MGILATDTFVGRTITTATNSWGTASDGHVWTKLNGNGVNTILSVASGEGLAHSGSTNCQMLLGSGTAANQEGVARLAMGQAGDSIGILLRCDGTGANYYYAEIGLFSNDITVNKVVAGTKTLIDIQAAGFTVANGSFYWIRFQVIGTTLKCRIWADGNAEPGTWQSTSTDSTFASGQYGLFLNSFGTIDSQFDHYQANDTTSAMPLMTQAEAKFFVKANLQTQARAKFLVRLKLVSGSEAKFYVRSILRTQAQSKFLIRIKLATVARAKFVIRLALRAQAWSRFLVNQVIAPPTHFTSVIWKTRDLVVTWVTRDGKTTWKTRE